MKKTDLHTLSTSQLVERFRDVALKQYWALLGNELRLFNKLFDEMTRIEQELKGRPGDQRRALRVLYDHPNPQVRVKAAKRSLAVEYDAALKVIKTSRHRPNIRGAGGRHDARCA